MTNLVELKKPELDFTRAVAIIDEIKAQLVSGEFKALLMVGITPESDVALFQLGVENVSSLEILGAISIAQQSYYDQDDE